MNDNIIICLEQAEIVNELSDAQAGQVLKALLSDGQPPEDIAARIVFKAIKAQVDRYKDKYNRRAEAGKKGMQRRWDDNKGITNDNNALQTITNDNKGITNNNNAITNDNKGITNDNKLYQTITPIPDPIPDPVPIKERSSTIVDDSMRSRIIAEWNSLEPLGITPIKAIKEKTKRADSLAARIRQYGEGAVLDAIRGISEQKYLHGQTWFTFDWFVKPNNFTKVYEKNYKDRNGQHDRMSVVDEWLRGHLENDA